MKTFREIIKEWDFASGYTSHHAFSPGASVTINKPGHEHHGKTGKVVRSQGIERGIEVDGHQGKLHWLNAGHLK